ncbi:OmpH family outer membrane protein [Flavobacterium gelidilacus]|jgi:Skp family chaperone for outer membrane proteins|uniref:OmpH family outer membrane protein n=1 Tax=Flavobacterium gelidilacus TaxID=206041 RepID=UPI000405FA9C|nr:OmpH family outer membrane protein [Flavobacterium gelidilacus]
MKKIVLLFLFLSTTIAFSQSRGIRIGFIDMEYILEKVPNYAEAKNQLEIKAQKWKQEIEAKKNEINKLKEDLKIERPLLTKELIEEREEEINYLDTELLEYQQNRFGPKGDLIIQKSVLVKPIQDQVFTIIQDIAEQKKYDFIFDKSSDMTMLFAAQRYDISDQVVRQLVRAEKREQLTSKQLKEQESRDALEDMQDENPEMAARQKALDEKRAAREKLIEDKKAAYEARKKEAADRRQKLIEEREAKKNGTLIEEDNKTTTGDDKTATEGDKKTSTEADKLTPEEVRQKALDDRNKKIEDRKKAAEDRRAKILEEREAAKAKKEEENKTGE